MLIIYRITSISSSNPSPIYQENKNKLNELCLRSFVQAFSDVEKKVIYLLDHGDCEQMIRDLSKTFPYEIRKSNVGQNQTMIDSYRIAAEMDDYVLFQECDYLYRGIVGRTFLEALKVLRLVSPYDHPNFYKEECRDMHSEECRMRLVDNHHFRTTERNTMTWGCHSSMVKENQQMLERHGYLDGPVWIDLKNEGYPLWVPIPSFATHMAEGYLSPGVEWNIQSF